jgi:short-subunit dehydrogenase
MRKTGMAPEQVARVIEKALTSKKPKAHYLVGLDAKIQALMARFLPDKIRDRIMLHYMGIST